MDAAKAGSLFRELRINAKRRQSDVAKSAGVTRRRVIQLEAGGLAKIPFGLVEAMFAALGASAELRIQWKGERLDRLRDRAHAALVETMVALLTTLGWVCNVEVTFSVYGERGSIDILAWHPATRVLLVIEVKSAIPDMQSMLSALDRKVRLARGIAAGFGWKPLTVGRLLVVADGRTTRARLATHEATLATTFPTRGSAVDTWLQTPAGPAFGGLKLVPLEPSVRPRRRALARRLAGRKATSDAGQAAPAREEPSQTRTIPLDAFR